MVRPSYSSGLKILLKRYEGVVTYLRFMARGARSRAICALWGIWSGDWTTPVYIPTCPWIASIPENVSGTPLLSDASQRCFDAKFGMKNWFTKSPQAGSVGGLFHLPR
jgi:hypothetical protein